MTTPTVGSERKDVLARDVIVERHGHVLLVKLNRPDRHNAVGGPLYRELAEAFETAGQDDRVRAVVTCATGPDFCVGANVAEFAKIADLPARELLAGETVGGDKGLRTLSPAERAADDLGNCGRWTQRMWTLEKPTIAVINGCAVGGGLGIALLHDIRLAGAGARLGTGFAPAGLAPELGMSMLLPQLIGPSAAAELLFTGRLVPANEARTFGLVSDVVPDEGLLDRAMQLAADIAAKPPLGVRLTKRLLRKAMTAQLVDQLRAEYAAQLLCFEDPAARTGMEAVRRRVSRHSTEAEVGADGGGVSPLTSPIRGTIL